jgi:hypothetical protein
MEKRRSTTIFEHDFDQLKTIASQKGFLWPMWAGKKEGTMDSARTIHFLIQDYIGRRP